jgi:molybdopterin/thiamine biosynthesis adenylyltransferase
LIDLVKSYEFLRPESVRERIHIIGCGSVGSTVAELLARFGLTQMTLYDYDTVAPRNLANQLFRQAHIGMRKVDALAAMLCEINPEIADSLKLETDGYSNQPLSGYVFLCVDDIDRRREIATAHKDDPYVRAMFDFRTRLTDAQHYAADWYDPKMVENFLKTMNFTHAEAAAETPTSACNVTLSVAPTVRAVCALGAANFVNFAKVYLSSKN